MAKQVQLKPTTDDVIKLNVSDVKSLIQTLNGIKISNRALPPSALKFVLKNLKKLQALWDKMVIIDNQHRETFPKIEEYTQLTSAGNVLFSNNGKPLTEELKLGEVHLIEAYFDKESKKLVDTTSGEDLAPEVALKMNCVYLSDEKKLEHQEATKAYHDAQALNREEKHDCHVVFISYKFLDENKISIPTQVPLPSGEIAYPDAQLFYDNLVPDWDKDEK